MATPKYAVKNGDNILGIMWDVGNNREIFVTNNKMNLNFPLDIKDFDGNVIDSVDVIDILSEILPKIDTPSLLK